MDGRKDAVEAAPAAAGGVDHEPGTCSPSCSKDCFKAKIKSQAFVLPEKIGFERVPR